MVGPRQAHGYAEASAQTTFGEVTGKGDYHTGAFGASAYIEDAANGAGANAHCSVNFYKLRAFASGTSGDGGTFAGQSGASAKWNDRVTYKDSHIVDPGFFGELYIYFVFHLDGNVAGLASGKYGGGFTIEISRALGNGNTQTYHKEFDFDHSGSYDQRVTLKVPAYVLEVTQDTNGQNIYPQLDMSLEVAGGSQYGDFSEFLGDMTASFGDTAELETAYIGDEQGNVVHKYDYIQITGADGGDYKMGPPSSVPAFTQTLFVANQYANTVSQIVPGGMVTPFATSGLNNPRGVAFDAAGNLYVANTAANTIERFTPDGTGTVFASTNLSGPIGLAFDAAGNLFAANDGDNTVVRFDPTGAPVVVVTGGLLNAPTGLAIDATGNLYVANGLGNNVVRYTRSGAGSVFAASGLNDPQGLAFDTSGNLYVMNTVGKNIMRFTPDGVGSVFATVGASTDCFGLAFDPDGNLYTADYLSSNVTRFDKNGVASFVANTGTQAGPSFLGFPRQPTFFDGESALGDTVYYLAFPNGNYFGFYSFLSDPHYIYHFDLGYEYVFDAADGKAGVYFYDFKSGGFFYTSPTFPFPYLYDFTLNSVLYYYPDPGNPGRYNTNGIRYFYDFGSGKIISK